MYYDRDFISDASIEKNQENGYFRNDYLLNEASPKWDRLYLLPPHTDVNEFLKKNQLSWYGDKKENIKYQDGRALGNRFIFFHHQ